MEAPPSAPVPAPIPTQAIDTGDSEQAIQTQPTFVGDPPTEGETT